jgi:hypothetical protein
MGQCLLLGTSAGRVHALTGAGSVAYTAPKTRKPRARPSVIVSRPPRMDWRRISVSSVPIAAAVTQGQRSSILSQMSTAAPAPPPPAEAVPEELTKPAVVTNRDVPPAFELLFTAGGPVRSLCALHGAQPILFAGHEVSAHPQRERRARRP